MTEQAKDRLAEMVCFVVSLCMDKSIPLEGTLSFGSRVMENSSLKNTYLFKSFRLLTS